MPSSSSAWRAQLLKLGLFRALEEMIELNGGELSREAAIGEVQQRLPREDASRTFDTLVARARFGGLFAYDEGAHALSAE